MVSIFIYLKSNSELVPKLAVDKIEINQQKLICNLYGLSFPK